ncbi:MAG: type II toxin-antitoxin system Phd/YefM family antitoxin [Candidatus Omnitrophica bacterium]|nr:type II toxin-antitoxin system Phd/YefM family antitoxin [Candidatus Omnitrophota bacterium]
MKTTATEIKNHFGEYLEGAISEPVVIEKTGRPVAVMLSVKEYERLIALEDAYWAQKAINAEKSGYIGQKESAKLLKSK